MSVNRLCLTVIAWWVLLALVFRQPAGPTAFWLIVAANVIYVANNRRSVKAGRR